MPALRRRRHRRALAVRDDRRAGRRRARRDRASSAGAPRGPGLEVGICGEHGGDPGSIRLLPRRRARLRQLLAVPRADRARRGGAGGDRSKGVTSMSAKPQILVLGGGFAALETRVPAAHATGREGRHPARQRPRPLRLPARTASTSRSARTPRSLLVGPAQAARPAGASTSSAAASPRSTPTRASSARRRAALPLRQAHRRDRRRHARRRGAGARRARGDDLDDRLDARCPPALPDARDRARRGERQRVLFLVPPNNKCSGPLYEIVFMLETWLRREGAREHGRHHVVDVRAGFIQAFGPRLHELVTREFAERGIDGHTDEVVDRGAADEVRYADGSTRGFDQLIAFPPYVAAVRYDGAAVRRPRLRRHRASRPPARGGPRRRLRPRRRRRLPDQAGVPRLPAGRRRRRAHRRRRHRRARSRRRSTR